MKVIMCAYMIEKKKECGFIMPFFFDKKNKKEFFQRITFDGIELVTFSRENDIYDKETLHDVWFHCEVDSLNKVLYAYKDYGEIYLGTKDYILSKAPKFKSYEKNKHLFDELKIEREWDKNGKTNKRRKKAIK